MSKRSRKAFRQWYEKNRDKKLSQNAEWKSSHQDEVRAYARWYYHKNKRKLRQQHVERYHKLNPDARYYKKGGLRKIWHTIQETLVRLGSRKPTSRKG